MKPSAILLQCEQLGICVTVDRDHLRITAPHGTMTTNLSASIKKHKQKIIEYLTDESYQERAAIIEYEGGHDRDTAQMLAKAITQNRSFDMWAVFNPDGRILADSDFKSEADAWTVALGWPDASEIEQAIQNGWRTERATLIIDNRHDQTE